MVIEKFPLSELNSFYLGKEFLRISPITGCSVKGIVKKIIIRNFSHTENDVYYSKPQLGVISTNNVDYDFSEVFFNHKTDLEFRHKIAREIEEKEKEEELEKIIE
jgi:hypothetical protein